MCACVCVCATWVQRLAYLPPQYGVDEDGGGLSVLAHLASRVSPERCFFFFSIRDSAVAGVEYESTEYGVSR